jgi:hypothetical protein
VLVNITFGKLRQENGESEATWDIRQDPVLKSKAEKKKKQDSKKSYGKNTNLT